METEQVAKTETHKEGAGTASAGSCQKPEVGGESLLTYSHAKKMARHIVSIPFIYIMVVPLVMLDVALELYHHICFPLYGLPRKRRKEYIRLDRERLPFLKWYEKLNCAYCSYANGLLHYATAIAGETERYWCPLKHESKDGFREPAHHEGFAEFADEKRYREINLENDKRI